MSLQKHLSALFAEIIKEAKSNPHFAARLEHALNLAQKTVTPSPRPHRRAPAALDPFEVYAKGEATLRDRLRALHLEQLRDILAQYGMDRAKLAMKWKDENRVIDQIVGMVAARAQKGDAFRGMSAGQHRESTASNPPR